MSWGGDIRELTQSEREMLNKALTMGALINVSLISVVGLCALGIIWRATR